MKRKNFLTWLALALAFSLPSLAEEYSGKCGENTTYRLDTGTGLLTISGTGSISPQEGSSLSPWFNYVQSIRKVVVEDGVGLPTYDWLQLCTNIQEPVYNSTTFYYAPRNWQSPDEENTGLLPDGLTSIAPYACSGLYGLTGRLAIPGSYEEIGEYAFRNTGLKEIEFPSGIARIGEYAFSGCDSLREVSLPEELTNIPAWLFWGCDSLRKVTISERTDSIQEGAFNGCSRIEEFNFPESLCYIGPNALGFSLNPTEPLYTRELFIKLPAGYSGEYTVPEGIVTIHDNAFSGCQQLTAVHLPATVERIGSGAFESSSLKSIALPEGLKTIGEFAFSNSALESIDFPEGLEAIGMQAFAYSKLTSVDLPEGLKTLEQGAFSYCPISAVTFPSTLREIGSGYGEVGVFQGCENLQSVVIPATVEYVGNSAFAYCKGLTSATFESPDTRLGFGVFDGCSLQAAITQGDTYYKCPAGTTEVVVPEGIKHIAAAAFGGCSQLQSVSLPESLETIGYNAFNNCSSLSEIIIPENVDTLGQSAFYHCTALREITIPESVTRIESNTFQGCTALTAVELLGTITDIGSYAFYECINLEAITLPDSLKFLGWSAFSGCKKLKAIEIPQGVLSLRGSTFEGCSNLQSVVLHEGLQSLESSEFEGCSKLVSIELPQSVQSLSYDLFKDCASLTEVKLSDAISALQTNMFAGCTSLKSLQLPAALWSFSADLFKDCPNMTYVSIPESNRYFRSHAGILYDKDMNNILYIPAAITEIEMADVYYMDELKEFLQREDCKVRSLTLPYIGRQRNSYSESYAFLGSLLDYEASDDTQYSERGEDGYTYTVTEHHYKFPASLEKLVLHCDSFQTLQMYYDQKYNREITRHATCFDGVDTIEIHSAGGINAFLFSERAQGVRSLLLDGDVTLPYNSFAGMDSLRSLTVTKATTLEAGCLGNLIGLRELTLPYAGAGSASTAANFGELFGSATDERKQRVVQYHEDGSNTTYYIPLIEKLTLLEGLTTLPYGALSGCSMLRELTLPASLYMVGERALYGCAGLTDIHCLGAEPAAAYGNTFEGVRVNSCTLHVPYNASDMYRRSTGWEDFYYIEEEAPIRISVWKNIENAGVIYGLQEYQPGDTAELRAVANSGYTFSGWTELGTLVSTEGTYTFVVESDRDLIAVFTPVSGSNEVETTPGSRQVSFTWQAEEGAETYRLDVFTDEAMTQLAGSILFDATGQVIKRALASTLTATIDGLDPATAYYYRMTAYDAEEQTLSQYTGTFSTTEATGLDETAIEAARVEAIPGGIAIGHAAGQPVRIYTASGRPVAAFTAGSDYETVRLEKGLYLVTIGRKTCKVAL